HALRHAADPLRRADRRAAELLHDRRHRASSTRTPRSAGLAGKWTTPAGPAARRNASAIAAATSAARAGSHVAISPEPLPEIVTAHAPAARAASSASGAPGISGRR